MPDVSGRGRGDLFVTVKVITPKKLTKEQKKLLEQLAGVAAEGTVRADAASNDEDKGLFDRVKDIFG